MPYITRDSEGNVVRIALQPVHGAENVSYDHPELRAFLKKNGQDPRVISATLAELRKTDLEMARTLEDLITALLKKNILKMTDLPTQTQERLTYRLHLRVMVQDAFNRAAEQNAIDQSNARALAEGPSGSDPAATPSEEDKEGFTF
ncbi:MAG: hypothetical protein FWF24_07175 [Alphaproteobacteria bacterium]|nr:hypothetical protein [Alphaproteobacteria bacterium]